MSQDTTRFTKMLFLIRHRAHTTRDALVAQWFKNHMPNVIAAQSVAKARGFNHATRYWATLFQETGERSWDGVAQLWFQAPMPYPDEPFGTQPSDSFQEHAEPYHAWETKETVLFDHLPFAQGLTLNEPYPTTRTSIHRITLLIPTESGSIDLSTLNHWLGHETGPFQDQAEAAGCLRCAVSLSTEIDRDPYLGAIEFYFAAADDWQNYSADVGDAFIQSLLLAEGTEIYFSDTELIGIP
jgi:hypothetical protein